MRWFKKRKNTEKEWDRFMEIMKTPLKDVKQEDLEWAVEQDKFNSANSKGFFEQEIKRRKNEQNI